MPSRTRPVVTLFAAMLAVSTHRAELQAQQTNPGSPQVATPGAGNAPAERIGQRAIVLDGPQPMKVELAGGGTAVGQVGGWDDQGLDATVDGTTKRLAWDELSALDAYRLRKRLGELLPTGERTMAMLALAAYLKSRDDATKFAERAFDDARRWGATEADRVRVQERSEEWKQTRNERLARAARARLQEGSPEAAPFASVAWPVLTTEEQEAAKASLRKEMTERLAATGRELTPIDGKHVAVYSSLGVTDGARRATEIERFIEGSLERLGLARETIPWFGRLIVVVSDDRDRFRLVEASCFKSQPRDDESAITHYDGAKVFVHIAHQADESSLRMATFRATALGLLHRLGSPARLPAWAHEGLADWLVATYAPTKALDLALRQPGLQAIRARGGFAVQREVSYQSGAWPFRDLASRGEAFVLTSYLIERQRDAFLQFLRIVKSGEPWHEAFKRAFSVTIERAAVIAWDYHRVND